MQKQKEKGISWHLADQIRGYQNWGASDNIHKNRNSHAKISQNKCINTNKKNRLHTSMLLFSFTANVSSSSMEQSRKGRMPTSAWLFGAEGCAKQEGTNSGTHGTEPTWLFDAEECAKKEGINPDTHDTEPTWLFGAEGCAEQEGMNSETHGTESTWLFDAKRCAKQEGINSDTHDTE